MKFEFLITSIPNLHVHVVRGVHSEFPWPEDISVQGRGNNSTQRRPQPEDPVVLPIVVVQSWCKRPKKKIQNKIEPYIILLQNMKWNLKKFDYYLAGFMEHPV